MGIKSIRHMRFIDRYLNHGNQTLAYIEAGFAHKGARQNASRLMANDDIKEALELERERLTIGLQFSRDQALRILVEIATATFGDFVPLLDKRKAQDQEAYAIFLGKNYALKSVKIGKYGVDIKLHDSMAAIETLWIKLGFDNEPKPCDWGDGFERIEELLRRRGKS